MFTIILPILGIITSLKDVMLSNNFLASKFIKNDIGGIVSNISYQKYISDYNGDYSFGSWYCQNGSVVFHIYQYLGSSTPVQ